MHNSIFCFSRHPHCNNTAGCNMLGWRADTAVDVILPVERWYTASKDLCKLKKGQAKMNWVDVLCQPFELVR